jgi:hypothetical protein
MKRRYMLTGLAASGIAWIAGRGNTMEQIGTTGVLFIAGFGPIVRDTQESRKLYGKRWASRSRKRPADIFIPAT